MMQEPEKVEPGQHWTHIDVYRNVKEALYALPAYFRTETEISGIRATDIFTLNAALSATIEEQVVNTLNSMRPIWDPEDKYKLYSFVRQPQTFPDVLLKRYSGSGSDEIVMGIELKGWYLLAKEGEPSFRFTVTPNACAYQDLIVVVPWALSNVISGVPKIFLPFVENARYVAEYRNYHWQHIRKTRLKTKIISPSDARPYPNKSDHIADRPVSDSGGNFGRLARTGIMDAYLESTKSQELCGIRAKYWLAFFKIFQEQRTEEDIQIEIERLATQIRRDDSLEE